MNLFTQSASPTLLDLQRQRLEILIDSPGHSAYRPGRLTQLLQKALHTLLQRLTPGDAPRIAKIHQGDVEVWRVYDPISDRTLTFDDEGDLRVWLEQRYYQ
jgi:hypothetical protein